MMVGVPASGKSSVAEYLADVFGAKIHSSDSLRNELFGTESHMQDNDKLFAELHKRIKADLSKGTSSIYDACNINYKKRKAFLQEISKFNPHTICVLVPKSFEDCIADNAKRERNVPDEVIRRMICNFWVPQSYEGWDEIQIVAPFNQGKSNLAELRDFYNNFDQENKHHSLSLGSHMAETTNYLKNNHGIEEGSNLHLAAFWHDMGKPFTKTFERKNGTSDGNAHYYNHHNVGAYQFLVMANEYEAEASTMLSICNFIQWHMRPYDIERSGGNGRDKFIKLVGREFYDDLMLLHEADKAAH